MYRLGNTPNRTDNISDIADFIEVLCLTSSTGTVSLESVRRIMSIESDELNFEGINDDDDWMYQRLAEVFSELKRRKIECANHYPFCIEDSLIEIDTECSNIVKDYYSYLLLATRANMRDDRLFGEPQKDAALIFEKVSELIIRAYFGINAQTMIFGTSAGMSFKDKVERLLQKLKLNANFRTPIGSTGRQKDGKIDLVVWIPFSDERDSMFIGLGQCKTGTSWNDKLSELQPSSFFSNYTNYTPIHTPSKIYFIADSISIAEEKWEERARNAGILFDRRRIMEFLPNNIPEELTSDIRNWNNLIIQKYCTS